MNFITDNFFMIRAPFLSINSLQLDELTYNRLVEFIKDKNFLTALAVSSNDLYLSIDTKFKAGINLNKKEINSILGFISRSISRATPYGHFAGVAIGSFANTTAQMKFNGVRKVTLVDSQWLYAVINKIEKLDDILYNLRVTFNPSVIKAGDRMKLLYASGFGQSADQEVQASFRYNKHVAFVKKHAEKPVEYKKLLEMLSEENESTPIKRLDKFLKELVHNEALITELRCPITDIDPLKCILFRLNKIPLNKAESIEIVQHLREIDRLIDAFNTHSSISDYIILRGRMTKIVRNNNFFNGLLKLELSESQLGKNIQNDLNDFAANLTLLASRDVAQINTFYKYKKAFLEKYGQSTEVRLVELFEENIGLGSPYQDKYQADSDRQTSLLYNDIQACINDKLIHALINKEKEIVITDDDIANMKGQHENIDPIYAESFEICFELVADSVKNLNDNRYEIVLGENIGSNRAGNHFNRFSILYSDDQKQKIRSLNEMVQDRSPYFNVDVRELPKNGRMANIACGVVHYPLLLMGLYANNYDTIDISDIYIGYDSSNQALYARSKSNNRILKAISDSMLNIHIFNSYLRFMTEIVSFSEINPLNVVNYFRNFSYEYMPKIKMGNIVIKNESWIFKKQYRDVKTVDIFKNELLRFANQYSMPDLVYLTSEDNKILVHLKNNLWIEFLYAEYKKSSSLKFTYFDKEMLFCDLLTDKANNCYHTEFVVSFCVSEKTGKHIEKKSVDMAGSWFDQGRILLPAQENWLYFKLYIRKFQTNGFLIELNDFLAQAKQHGQIDLFFFLIYSDPDYHIRLRVRFLNSAMDVMGYLYGVFERLSSDKLDYYVIDTYQREFERYGGAEHYGLVEEIFYFDSKVVMELRKNESTIFAQCDGHIPGIHAVHEIMSAFFPDEALRLEALRQRVTKTYMKKEYLRKKQSIINFFSSICSIDEKYQQLNNERADAITKYRILIVENIPMTYFFDIAHSVMHMFCNRFKTDSIWENSVISYYSHYLHDEIQKRKYSENKEV